ncbi:MAG: hypothetical protein WC496_09820 [Phycisphaerae bacterium]|jgi:lysozyme family protein
MPKDTEIKIWKIRTVKTYPEAHNHIIVGHVLEITSSYVRMDCRTYHFGKMVNSEKDVYAGINMVRIIPWTRIEIINELSESFDYADAHLSGNKDGTINIKDKQYAYSLVSQVGKKY